jgi:hypothetical protein
MSLDTTKMNTEIVQSWISTVVDAILTKISSEHRLDLDSLKNTIGTITISNDIDASIAAYCSSLAAEKEKPKKLVKKKIVVSPSVETVLATEPLATSVEAMPATLEVKLKKVIKKKVVSEATSEANAEPEVQVQKPKKVLKKKVEEPTDAVVTTTASVTEEKPKKVLKKKADVPETVTVDTPPTEDQKPKKVIKKRITVDVTETPVEVKDIQAPEEEVKIVPKKIIKKKATVVPLVSEAEPKKQSRKNIDIAEYGVEGENTHEIYEAAELYEDDSVEPREIGGVKYYIDTSNYIYDFESMDLIGKLNEQDNTKVIFLADFTSSDEEAISG